MNEQMRKESRSSYNHFSWLWWIGVPILVILLSYGPFVFMNCVLHSVGSACWRVPTVGHLIFDFSFYSSLLVSSASGAHDVHLIPAICSWLFRLFHLAIPAASPAEIWLFFRIVFGILTWWLSAWTLGAWTDMPQMHRRVTASVLWLAVFLPLGFRGGIYSWYMPFGFVLLAACSYIIRSLEQRRIHRALLWTAIGFVISLTYSWFLVFACLWFVSVWCEWFVLRMSRRWTVIAWSSASVAVVVGVVLLVWRYGQFVDMSVQNVLRLGLAFTPMPILSTMLFAAMAWFVAIFILSLRSNGESSAKEFALLLRAWIVTILAWCSSMFMGVFFQNDHFRIFVLLFAWISSAVLLHRIHGIDAQKGQRLTFFVFIAALIASFAYIIKPYALDHNQLNTIHLFVWFALAITTFALTWPKRTLRIRPRTIAFVSIVTALCIGLPQYAVMLASENARWDVQQTYLPLFLWMKSSIPETEQVCVDPPEAEFISSQSGRLAFFTQDVYTRSNQDVQNRMKVFASLRLVDEHVIPIWTPIVESKYVACGQFTLQREVLESFLGTKRSDAILGCDRQTMTSDSDFIKSLDSYRGKKNKDAASVCPWIIVNKTMKDAWSIPQEYQKEYDDGRFEVYRGSSF